MLANSKSIPLLFTIILLISSIFPKTSEASPALLVAPILCAGPQIFACLVAGGFSVVAAGAIASKRPKLVVIEGGKSTRSKADSKVSVTVEGENNSKNWTYQFLGKKPEDEVLVRASRKRLSEEDCFEIRDDIRKKTYYDNFNESRRISVHQVGLAVFRPTLGSSGSKATFLVVGLEGDIDIAYLQEYEVAELRDEPRLRDLMIVENLCTPESERPLGGLKPHL